MPGEKRSVASLLGQPALLQIIEKSAGDKSDKAAEWSNVCNNFVLPTYLFRWFTLNCFTISKFSLTFPHRVVRRGRL